MLDLVKNQVESSMEWEELQNTVFEQIDAELTRLSNIVFEVEERRIRPCPHANMELGATDISAPHTSNTRFGSASGPS